MVDTAVLYLTHRWTESIAARFERLRREVAGSADCHVLLDSDGAAVLQAWRATLESIGAPSALADFRAADLPQQLGFRFYGAEGIMGNTHFPVMRFARNHAYRYYWVIEADVEYRGDWGAFLGMYEGNDAPLLATHFHHHAEWPTWYYWPSLTVPTGPAFERRHLFKAFLTAYRISAPAIAALDEAHAAGWGGHFEVLIPSLLAYRGLRMQDLRARHRCYVGDSQDPSPILPLQSTMRWRPEVARGEFSSRGKGPLLFHPVKANWAFDGKSVVEWPEPPALA